MAQNQDDQGQIRQYLLGQLPEDQRQKIEQRLLTDDDFFEELELAEAELSHEYAAEKLSDADRYTFEQRLLVNPALNRKLRFARALERYVSKATPPADDPEPRGFSLLSWVRQPLVASPVAVAAAALIVIALGFAVWRLAFYQSDVDKGLVALNAAYREQRPVEVRLTQLNYAPFSTTRGDGSERVNSFERDSAERYLMDAVRDHPGAASYNALGKLYLARKDFDRAIAQFEQALKADPNNAQAYADLGAALLEKGKIDKTGPEPGKGMEELARSRENLNRALQLDPNLLEALFNRALCSEYQLTREQAEADWKEYLKRDPDSPWAKEARERLKRLEEQKTRTSRAKEQLPVDFLRAHGSGDDATAWAALSRSRARDGNSIVEALLDDYLLLAIGGHQAEAAEKLEQVSYAGKVEQDRIGDRFTSDLARYYKGTRADERDRLARARAQTKAAKKLYDQGEFERASLAYLQSREMFARLEDHCETLLADSWVGYCYLRIPKTEQSLQIFERLSREFEAKNYRFLFAQSLPALADAESSRNEFSRTLDYDYRGLKLSREIEDNVTAVRCLAQTVSMHLTLGDYRRSLESLIQAVELADTLSPDPRLTWQLYAQATLDFHFLRFPASALAFGQEALALAEASGVPLLRSRSWEQLGVIYSEQRNHQEAIKSGKRALAEGQGITDRLSRANIVARSLLTLGRLQQAAAQPREAIQYFDQSISLYQELNFDAYSYEAHKGKLLELIALHDDAAADAELQIVLALFEQNREKIAEESNRDKFFDAGQDTYDIATDFAYSRLKDKNRAFQYADNSRARSLLEMMNSGAQIKGDTGNPEIGLASRTNPLTQPEIQAQMPEPTQILEYALLDDKLIAWVVTRRDIKATEIPLQQNDLRRKIHDYQSLVARGSPDTKDAQIKTSKELYSILLAPVESLLDQKLQLFIVADKDLNYVPFATLISPTSGRYLIEEFSVAMTPSASVLVSCSARAKQRSGGSDERLLSVGNPSFDHNAFPGLTELTSAEREVETIGSFYPSPTVLVGRDALPNRVRNELPNANVIHLATHSVADQRSPLLSRLLLANNLSAAASSHHAIGGFLQASELYSLKLPRARLAVLSACQTGIERTYRGEGAIGLARPFLVAGVPIVVASLWPVDSESTAELMISFHKYRRLKQLSTAAALRQAQLEMIRNPRPGSQDTFGWAAFVTIGGYADF
jgi:CHAT domain-containing protein/Flp pilus assembly protein TadD